ncbi:Elongator complex protein 5 [Lasiosphaeria hispida]|uniref:Elongator complex protein 5 n=1 Tax=Lasiosphaeria hispida TaxID=260671 RepID=A0AAJ0HPK3_9PEZI|nr:Elongator complex protein 5 [Lasiosphaeria hispida]
MAPSVQAHHRSHSLLLLQKLLNLRDTASPLTLILDTLEQSAGPLVREFINRAKIGRSKVIFISFATVKKPHDADIFIKARGKPLAALAAEIASHCPPTKTTNTPPQKYLLLLDALNPLAPHSPLLPAFFSAIITSPLVSLVATYHTDVPVPSPTAPSYAPHPLTLLTHLATTVFRVSSLAHAVAIRRAHDRSVQEPEWGLREGREGVLVGLRGDVSSHGGAVVVEMEMRRRSGRAVAERFVFTPAGDGGGKGPGAGFSLLSDHPLFAAAAGGSGDNEEDELVDSTFSLGLTEKQRRDREGVVLPYFDAQTEVGGGEGGRILYEMGREDDFDEEEDEI